MLKYRIYYTNGTNKVLEFDSKEEAHWFIHNEGDHVIEYKREKSEQQRIR